MTSIGAEAFKDCPCLTVIRVSNGGYVETLKQKLAASGRDVSQVRFEITGPAGGPAEDAPGSPDDEVELYESYIDMAKGEVAPFKDAAQVYEGYLFDMNAIVGSVQVKVAKGKIDKKTGAFSAKVMATVQLVGEAKKLSFKGGNVDGWGSVSTMKDKDGRSLAISVGVNGLAGKLDGKYGVQGARSLCFGIECWTLVAKADGLVHDADGDLLEVGQVHGRGRRRRRRRPRAGDEQEAQADFGRGDEVTV